MKEYFKQVSSKQYISHVGGTAVTLKLVNS